ncbi:MAG TPA: TcfC E-set like domain-containing protein, partial [Sphingomicrobium sp.]
MGRRSFRAALFALAMVAQAAVALAAAANSNSATIETVDAPSGFDGLTRARALVADVYFGGEKVGEAAAVVSPGSLHFDDPAKVAALVPNAIDPAALAVAFTGEMPTHSELLCGERKRDHCGELVPTIAGIIFDEDHFRVDLFAAPSMLRAIPLDRQVYLPTPQAPVSLTSSAGVALSGSSGGTTTYNFQNRTIVGFHNARIRSDSSFASRFGFVFDDLVAEVDRPDMRYSGGLFWAPGLDLIGQRRIVGLGMGTQFDTRLDRDNLEGTPLVLFLAQPAQVDMIVDGRLVGSRAYDAGNNVLDTSGLPDGSYALVLRIHEAGGAVREERRFFVRNAQIAPIHQPLYFAYAGMLANTRPHAPISLSSTFYYQLGTARRLSTAFAVDASIIGTQKKAMAEIGGWFLSPGVRLRAALLASAAGDHGELVQVQSANIAGLNLNFDLRHITSANGRPLIPVPSPITGFDNSAPTFAQLGGTFTQASGSIGYRLGTASLSVIGSFRKDKGFASDYSIGPQLDWPVINRFGLQLAIEANAQRTRTTSASFIGFRLLSTRGRLSVINGTGYSSLSNRDSAGDSRSRPTGTLSAQYSYQGDDRTQVSLGGGVDRSLDTTIGHVGGYAYTRFGSARADMLHGFGGRGSTEYGVTLQTGLAVDPRDVVLGGRDLNESALVVTVAGPADYAFEVLVNGQPRGRVTGGQRLPLFLQPYRSYKVRLRPLDAAGVSYDNGAREVTLYPGNVQHLAWQVERMFTIFGQAVRD